jgi:hypothetical protein
MRVVHEERDEEFLNDRERRLGASSKGTLRARGLGVVLVWELASELVAQWRRSCVFYKFAQRLRITESTSSRYAFSIMVRSKDRTCIVVSEVPVGYCKHPLK